MDKEDIVSQKLVEERKFYNVYDEKWLTHWEDKPSDDTMDITVARNKNGDYIGNIEMARILCDRHGIEPECREPGVACAFGWSEDKERFFGWSHRAIVGFGVGNKVFDADCDEKLPFIERGKVDIKCKDDARIAAMNFAEHIG